jgi:hypothetical protein
MSPVALFVSDIDGCLAAPYQPYDLDRLQALAAHANAAGALRDDGTPPTARPVFTLCSGRPYSYVEAMTQALGLVTPVLFESGAGRFDPVAAQTTWHPALTDELEEQLDEMRAWFRTEAVPGTKISLDHAKRAQAGIVTPDPDEITAVRPKALAFVENHLPDLKLFTTDVSIDVLSPEITKRAGLKWLGAHLNVPLASMAYIGDTDGDIVALEAVGHSFAPANAHASVKTCVDYVTHAPVAAGTVAAYEQCVAQNEKQNTTQHNPQEPVS